MEKETFEKLCAQLGDYNLNLFNKDFLLTWNHSDEEIKAVATVAEMLKDMHKNGKSSKLFNSGLAISIFRDHSTRTRFSFASAANLMGLGLSELDEVKSQIAHGETVFETANMISFLTEIIGIRDDMYLGEGNKYMEEVGAAVQYGYDNGVLHQRPSIINLQSDIDHPTQCMSDLLKMKDYFGGFENLKGKKLAMSWAYSPSYGKPLSVPQGVIGLMSRFGMEISLAYPKGYDLIPEVEELARAQSEKSGGSFEITHSMQDAFKDADVVYPKSWAPFHIMEQRTELLKVKDQNGLKELEKECLANNAKYVNWLCDEETMKLTKDGKALYQHCLPADISGVSCVDGEVTKGVFDKYKKDTYQEAGYKPFVIAAMMYLSRVKDPASKLLDQFNNGEKIRI